MQTSFATLVALGKAHVASNSTSVVAQLWSQGITDYSILAQEGPVYVVSPQVNPTAPLLTFIANGYGTNPYSNTKVHMPAWAVNQCFSLTQVGGSDCHIAVIDYIQSIIVEGYQCDNNSHHNGILGCTWGRYYPIGSAGIATTGPHPGYGGNHAALSYTQFDITPAEVSAAEPRNGGKGYLAHALSMYVECTANPSIYPADAGSTDQKCSGAGSPGNFPQYGAATHIKSSVNVAALGGSQFCGVVLATYQKMGAYISDTGAQGIGFYTLPDGRYVTDPAHPKDPWIAATADLEAGDDATGTYSATNHQSVSWRSCLNRVPQGDLEYFTVTP